MAAKSFAAPMSRSDIRTKQRFDDGSVCEIGSFVILTSTLGSKMGGPIVLEFVGTSARTRLFALPEVRTSGTDQDLPGASPGLHARRSANEDGAGHHTRCREAQMWATTTFQEEFGFAPLWLHVQLTG